MTGAVPTGHKPRVRCETILRVACVPTNYDQQPEGLCAVFRGERCTPVWRTSLTWPIGKDAVRGLGSPSNTADQFLVFRSTPIMIPPKFLPPVNAHIVRTVQEINSCQMVIFLKNLE